MLVGVVIGFTSDYFTGDDKKPVEKVAEASESGPAFTILSGFPYGLSVLPSIIGIGIAALGAYKLVEPLGEGYPMFGISIAAIGMLSIVGMIISNDAYGPLWTMPGAWQKWENWAMMCWRLPTSWMLQATPPKLSKGFAIELPALPL